MTKARKIADLVDANGDIVVGNLDNINASNITTGTLEDARIPSLNASKITAGTLPVARGGTGFATIGSANQVLKVNASGSQLEFGNVTVPTTVSSFTNDKNYRVTVNTSTTAFGNVGQQCKVGSLGSSAQGETTTISLNCNCNCDCNG